MREREVADLRNPAEAAEASHRRLAWCTMAAGVTTERILDA